MGTGPIAQQPGQPNPNVDPNAKPPPPPAAKAGEKPTSAADKTSQSTDGDPSSLSEGAWNASLLNSSNDPSKPLDVSTQNLLNQIANTNSLGNIAQGDVIQHGDEAARENQTARAEARVGAQLDASSSQNAKSDYSQKESNVLKDRAANLQTLLSGQPKEQKAAAQPGQLTTASANKPPSDGKFLRAPQTQTTQQKPGTQGAKQGDQAAAGKYLSTQQRPVGEQKPVSYKHVMAALQQQKQNPELTQEQQQELDKWMQAMRDDPESLPPEAAALFAAAEAEAEETEKKQAAQEGEEIPEEGEKDNASGQPDAGKPRAKTSQTTGGETRVMDTATAYFSHTKFHKKGEGAAEGDSVHYTMAEACEGASQVFGTPGQEGAAAHGLRQQNTGLRCLEGGAATMVCANKSARHILFGRENPEQGMTYSDLEAPGGFSAGLDVQRQHAPTRGDVNIITDGQSRVALTDDQILRYSRENIAAGGDGSFSVKVGQRSVTFKPDDVSKVANAAGIRRFVQAKRMQVPPQTPGYQGASYNSDMIV